MEEVTVKFNRKVKVHNNGRETIFDSGDTVKSHIYNIGYNPLKFDGKENHGVQSYVTVDVPIERGRKGGEGPSGDGRYYVRVLKTFVLNEEVEIIV